MIKFIFRAFVVISIALVSSTLVESLVVRVFGRGVNSTIDGHSFTYSRLKDARAVENIRYIALGSSHCYRSFVSEGNNLLNLGSTAQTHIQTSDLIRDYVTSIDYEIVFYEVYPEIFFLDDGLESQVDINLASTNYQSIKNIFKLYSIKNFRSVLNSCALDLFNLKEKASLRGYLDAKNTYTNGGYVSRIGNTTNLVCKTRSSFDLSRMNLEQLRSFTNNVKKLKGEVYLVIAPYSYAPENINEYSTFLNSISGLEVLDYSALFCDNPDEFFFDSGHLNTAGANEFTRILLRSLENKLED